MPNYKLNDLVEKDIVIEHIGSMIYNARHEIYDNLYWNDDEYGNGWLTLKEIEEQINTSGVIRVIMDYGLYGYIFEYNNYSDSRWYVYALTKGYA